MKTKANRKWKTIKTKTKTKESIKRTAKKEAFFKHWYRQGGGGKETKTERNEDGQNQRQTKCMFVN